MSVSSQIQSLIKVMTSNVLSAIQLFGFDVDYHEKQFKLALNSMTFCKPNPKAFEVIVHFLLTQLDPERAQKSFGQCWPPILKEQMKEFKDTMYHWLVEITSSKQQKDNTNAKYQTLLNNIKFPNITKSLLMTPGGLKICELLLSLAQHVLFLRLLRLIESGKLNKRIWPKVSAYTTPLNIALNTNNSELNKQSISNAKFLSLKQLTQFEIQRNSLKHKIDYELSEFDHLLSNIINVRYQWQIFFEEKIDNIRVLIEKKAKATQSLAKKKAKLGSQLNLNINESGQECSLEEICKKFNGSRLTNFENKWSNFMSINKGSIEIDAMKQEIKRLTNGEMGKLELNGVDFIQRIESEQNETKEDFNKRILRYAYENIDQNAALRNTKVGDLFHENGTKLDLINLIRLNSMVLILKGEKYSKIDIIKLKRLANMNDKMENSITDELLINQKCNRSESITNSKFSGLLAPRASINQQIYSIKTKLDSYLPKLEEKCEILMNEKYSILNKTSIDNSSATEENKSLACLKEYISFRNQPRKEACLYFKKKFGNNDCLNEIQIDRRHIVRNEHISFQNTQQESSNLCDNNSLFDRNSGQSFHLLDLSEHSNLELI